MQNTNGPDKSIVDLIRRKLEQARDQLVDRNLRNRLVNCPLLSTRSKQVRVIDEVPDHVFSALAAQKKRLAFAPGRKSDQDAADLFDPDHTVWVPPDDSTLGVGAVAARHVDSLLQTQLTQEGLQKRLSALYYESIEAEEEQGVNILYLAIGFLKWHEDARSEVERFAPLVLLPVELTREGARDKFKIRLRDEDLSVNISLKLWLAEQHSIQLPDLPDQDDWLPSQYFANVRASIKDAPRWEVLEDAITLGFFSFSKLLLWRDLDPKNWPTPEGLLGHSILRRLLAPFEENPSGDPPVIPDDRRIDDLFKSSDLPYVLDADSSQTNAIQTAMHGRDLVIQGPPGTGKSQTISNLIAAAVHAGKSVLFVAEKLAALEVVHQRLQDVGLAPICFELHSRRAAKQQVLKQIRMALDATAPPAAAAGLPGSVDEQIAALWAHSDRFHVKHPPSNYTPFEIVGAICRLQDAGVDVPDFTVVDAEKFSRPQVESILGEFRELSERLVISGVPARHPWRDCAHPTFNPLDLKRLSDLAEKLCTATDALLGMVKRIWPLVRPDEHAEFTSVPVSVLSRISSALEVASTRPNESIDVLSNPRWTKELDVLKDLLEKCKRLASLEDGVNAVFVEGAWSEEWTETRAQIAGYGRSLLRFMRGPYREAIRRFRGFRRTKLPDKYDDRVAAIDNLMECQRLRAAIEGIPRDIKRDLGEVWLGLAGSWPRLQELIHWLTEVKKLEPSVSIRNPRLLGWSEDSKTWAAWLSQISHHVESQLESLGKSIELVDDQLTHSFDGNSLQIGELATRAKAWKESPHRYNEWPPVSAGLRRAIELTNSTFHARIYRGMVQPADLVNRVSLAIHEQIWNAMCRADNQLSLSDGRLLTKTLGSFRDLDRKWIRSAAREVARKHYDQKPTGSAGEMGVIRSEINKSRKLLPVRKLLDRAGHALQRLKPVFLMSPLSVAQYLAPGHLTFDLLLIDEASQVRPEDALGSIARANQIVVVGDAKQLPPTNFFNRMVSDSDDEPDDEEVVTGSSAPIGSMESILSLCDSTLSNRCMLSWHYRSQHPALIAVSNRNFYDDKLLLPPAVVRGHSGNGFGVSYRKTRSGGYDRGKTARNVLEAEEVANAVAEFARAHPNKTLGVGTFSVAQRDAIRDLVEDRRRREPEIEPFFSLSRERPFFVKNLESIQGDERDVIFISVGYGRDRDGRLTASFGPINNDGGERRLNVLISRARERCEVFGSITADDVDARSGKAGVRALKEFLQFAEKGYFAIPRQTHRTFDSDFEESVASFLVKSGYKVEPQIGMAGFYVDLGVMAPGDESKYALGIECDGAAYHSSRSARDRDRIRQEILESRGWTIYRIWSTDWFHRRPDQERQLLDAVERACSAKAEASVIQPVVTNDHGSESIGTQLSFPNAQDVSRESTVEYEEATFRVKWTEEPHQAPLENIKDTVNHIVRIEGPIHAEEIARRLATVWGLDRAGSRIQKVTDDGLRALARENRLTPDGLFWSLSGANERRVRNRANSRSQTLRKAEYLPPAEIVWAAAEILDECVRVQRDELVIEVARRFGFQRTGQDLRDAISQAISSKIDKDFSKDDDDFLTLRTTEGDQKA